MRRAIYPLLLAALAATIGPVHAQGWPSKPVRLILSQPPGASPDIAARIVAERLSRLWGQQVVVDNRDTVLKDKEIGRKLYDLGLVVDGAGSLAEVQAFLGAEHARWSMVTTEVGIQPE